MEEINNKKSIEKELNNLIAKYKIGDKVNLEKIKDLIYNEEGGASEANNRFMKKFLGYFGEPKSEEDFDKMIELATGCWNFFAHKSLNGLSPNEMVKKEMKNSKLTKQEEKQNSMPEVIVGKKRMSWEKYQQMLREMEKAQEPFKKFIDKDILPNYRKFFENKTDLSQKTKEKYIDVAERFFDRVLWVGFVNYEDIRLDFAQKDFPRWWQTHILYSNLDENQVWSALRRLIDFVKIRYDLELK